MAVMTEAMLGQQIGSQLAKAMGLDAKKVRSIDLRIAVNEAITAKVEMLADDGTLKTLVQLFRERLEPGASINEPGLESPAKLTCPQCGRGVTKIYRPRGCGLYFGPCLCEFVLEGE